MTHADRFGAHMRPPVGRATAKLRRAACIGWYVAAGLVVAGVVLLAAGQGLGWWRLTAVLSGSMEPTIPTHAAVFTTPAPAETLRVGDVIVYQIPIDDHRPVVHRVVEIVEGGAEPVVRTQGDANSVVDPWEARLEGGTVWRVAASVPHAGTPFVLLQDPGVRFAVMASSVLVALALILQTLWRRPRRPYCPEHAR